MEQYFLGLLDIFHISFLLGIRRMSNGLEIGVGVRFKKERD
jgi:hypothetical protein